MAIADSPLLTDSWPIYEAPLRLPLVSRRPEARAALDAQGIGQWSCRLFDNALVWSRAVYELFGLPPDQPVDRGLAVSLYERDSRIAMEQLRAHAIRHHRGFTMLARIRRPDGEPRWMRLTALPILCGQRVVRLIGTKQDVTAQVESLG